MHDMAKEHSEHKEKPISTKTLVLLYAWVAVCSAGLLTLIVFNVNKVPGVLKNPDMKDAIGIGAALGAVGGFARWIVSARSLLSHQASDLRFAIFESLLAPLLSAVLGVIVPFVLLALVAGPKVTKAPDDINWFTLYAVAALSGLFAPEAMSKLRNSFDTLFSGRASASGTHAKKPSH